MELEREKELVHLFKVEGCTKSRNELIMGHMDLCRKVARKRKTNYVDSVDDITGYAYEGLIKAVDKFEYSADEYPVRLSTYAMYWITGEMNKRMTNSTGFKLPAHVKTIRNSSNSIIREWYSNPENGEIDVNFLVNAVAQEHGIDVTNHHKKFTIQSIIGFGSSIKNATEYGTLVDGEGESVTVLDLYGYHVVDFDARDLMDDIVKDAKLTEGEANIIKMMYVDDMSIQEIADTGTDRKVNRNNVSKILKRGTNKIMFMCATLKGKEKYGHLFGC